MTDNRTPPDGNPHENPEAYFERYPVDLHDRVTLHSLAEQADCLISEPPGPGRVSQPSAEFVAALSSDDPTAIDRATDPPEIEISDTERPEPITTQPSPPLDEEPEEFIPAPTLRQMFADIQTAVDDCKDAARLCYEETMRVRRMLETRPCMVGNECPVRAVAE